MADQFDTVLLHIIGSLAVQVQNVDHLLIRINLLLFSGELVFDLKNQIIKNLILSIMVFVSKDIIHKIKRC